MDHDLVTSLLYLKHSRCIGKDYHPFGLIGNS